MRWPAAVPIPSASSRLRVGVLATLAWLSMMAAAAGAPKIDLVSLEKGDRLLCEIKGLDRGRLKISTDALDSVTVYWDRIETVVSPRVFEVEADDGVRYFGALSGAVARRLIVGSGASAVDLDMDHVIRITPLEAGFWQRLDGNIDLGFSFNKADLETRWTLNGQADYRARNYEGTLSLASQLTLREDVDKLSRNTLSVAARRLFKRRWFSLLVGQAQENQELGLELRTVAGGGLGRYFVQSNRTMLQVFSGVVYTRERFTDVPMRDSPEALIGTSWDWFSSRSNDIDLSTTAVGYFNVGGAARTRFELQSALRFEFLKDFYFSVNGYNSYDSRPPEDQASSDVGLSIALGWKF